MQHKEWQELIPFYVAQTLPPDEIRRFEAHLASCDSCQSEIDDWRMIASAVWREADDAAQRLPPLSQEVYNRLSYRDRAPGSRYSSNPPPVQQSAVPENVRPIPQSSRSRFPVTMVAGLVVAVFFGGLLIMLALRQQVPREVALNPDGDILTQEFGIGGGDETSAMMQAATPTSIGDTGIIPTLDPLAEASDTVTPGPPVFLTNTPGENVVLPPTMTPEPTNEVSAVALNPAPTQTSPEMSAVTAIESSPTATPTIDVPPPGGGPYITVTPDTFAGGIPLCEAFNPTASPIELFSQPDRNSVLTGAISSGDVFPVTMISTTGWYFVDRGDRTSGWLQAGFAYLRGNCVMSLPLATVVGSATPMIGTPVPVMNRPLSDTIVVIIPSYTDIYAGPDFQSEVLGLVVQNQQFPVSGYQVTENNRWILITLRDGSQVWVAASDVREYPADEAPPSPTPTP